MRNAIKNRLEAAFSLIEVALAITVVGLLMSGSIAAYRITTYSGPVQLTSNSFDKTYEALQKFLAQNGRLPCPARPELLTSDSDRGAGLEFCDGDTWIHADLTTTPDFTIPECNNASIYSAGSGICYALGRDADGNGSGDRILFGSIPYTTIGAAPENAYDGWERKIRYVVTESLTDSGTYSPKRGAIYVVNPESIIDINTSTGVVSPDYRVLLPALGVNELSPDPYGSAHFVMLSNGINRAGSYIFTPAKKIAMRNLNDYKCDSGTTTVALYFGLDFENCNNDAYFFSNKRRSLLKSNLYYYDDIVYPKFKVGPYNDGKWSYAGKISGTAPAVVTSNPSGRVGIGVAVPSQALDVNGNIKAEKIYAEKLCDSNGDNCIEPKVFSGSAASSCPGDGASVGVMVGISEGQAKCVNTTFKYNNGSVVDLTCTGCTMSPRVCDDGLYMYGVDAGGDILCH